MIYFVGDTEVDYAEFQHQQAIQYALYGNVFIHMRHMIRDGGVTDEWVLVPQDRLTISNAGEYAVDISPSRDT